MRILLTGASGFLGQRIVERLLKDGHELLALARSEQSANRLKDLGVTPILADLNAPNLKDKIQQAGVPDAVFHLAAEIATQRSVKKLWQVNHEGTTNLYEALKTFPLKRFIFASTVVVGEANGNLLTEKTELNVETEYGKTKQASEKSLLAAFRKDGFPAIIIRPSHIYGPGGWFNDLMTDLKKGLFRIPGRGDNWWDVVHVDDVAAAFVHLLEKGENGEIYHCADDLPVTMKDFFLEAGTYLGKKKIGHAPIFLARLLKGSDPVKAGVRSAKSSNGKLKATGWKPAYADFRVGLKEVFQRNL